MSKPKSGKQRSAEYRQKLSSTLAALGFHGKNATKEFIDAVFSAGLDDIIIVRRLLKKAKEGRDGEMQTMQQ